MSQLLNVTGHNFVRACNTVANTNWTPCTWLHRGSSSLVAATLNSEPTKDIYCQSIPRHVAQVALAGPRYGAQAAAVVTAGSEAWLTRSVAAKPTEAQELPQLSFVDKCAGVVGSIMGGVTGLIAQSIHSLAWSAIHLGGLAAGAAVGAAVWLPLAASYGLWVALSKDKRAALTEIRQQKRAAGLDELLSHAVSDGYSSEASEYEDEDEDEGRGPAQPFVAPGFSQPSYT